MYIYLLTHLKRSQHIEYIQIIYKKPLMLLRKVKQKSARKKVFQKFCYDDVQLVVALK